MGQDRGQTAWPSTVTVTAVTVTVTLPPPVPPEGGHPWIIPAQGTILAVPLQGQNWAQNSLSPPQGTQCHSKDWHCHHQSNFWAKLWS